VIVDGCGWWFFHLVVGVLQMLRQMRQVGAVPTVRTVSAVLSMCLTAGEFEALRSLVAEVEGWSEVVFDVPIYNIVISSFAAQKDIDSADRWLDRLRNAGLKPTATTYSSYIRVAAAANNLKKAREAFDNMVQEGLEVSVFVANTLVQLLANSSQHFDEAERLAFSLPEKYGVKPNTQTFSNLLRKLAERSEGERALEVYKKMKSLGVEVDAWAVRETVWAASKARCLALEQLKEIADDLLGLQVSSKDGEGRKKGLVLAHGGVIRACDKVQDADLALLVWQSVVSKGLKLDEATVGSFLGLLSRARRNAEILNVYEHLCGTSQDTVLGEGVMSYVLGALATVDPLRCMKVFQQAKSAGKVDKRAYNHAITALDSLGDIEGVEKVAKEMADAGHGFDRLTYGSYLRSLANNGKVDEAMTGLRNGEKVGVSLSNYTVAMTVIGLKKTKQYKPAIELMHELKKKGISLNLVAYNSILTVCGTAHAWAQSLEVLGELVATGLEPDSTSLQQVVSCLASAKKEEEIIKVVKQYGPSTIFPKMDYFLFRSIAQAAVSVDPPYVLTVAKAYVDRAQARTFKQVRSTYCMRRGVMICHAGICDERCGGVGGGGQVIDLLGARRQSPEIAEAVMRLYPKKEMQLYSATAAACLRGGMHDRACELIQEAEKEGLSLDQVGLSLGLQSAYLTDNLSLATEYLDKLQASENHKNGNSTANFGVCVLAKTGEWGRVLELLEDITSQQEVHGRLFGVNELTIATVGEVAMAAGLEEDKKKRIVDMLTFLRRRYLAVAGQRRDDDENGSSNE